MEFRVEDVTVNTRSLGEFGTGESVELIHNPTKLSVRTDNEHGLISAKEKTAMLELLKLQVQGAPEPEKPKTFVQIDAEYKIRSMQRLHRLAGTVLKQEYITDWFSKPHEMLGGKTPFEMCFTDEGYDQVENILAGAAYGFPS